MIVGFLNNKIQLCIVFIMIRILKIHKYLKIL